MEGVGIEPTSLGLQVTPISLHVYLENIKWILFGPYSTIEIPSHDLPEGRIYYSAVTSSSAFGASSVVAGVVSAGVSSPSAGTFGSSSHMVIDNTK